MLDALQTLVDNGLDNCTLSEIIDNLVCNDCFEYEADKKALVALAWCNEGVDSVEPKEIMPSSEDTIIIGSAEYLVLTDDEADEMFDSYLENMLDDGGVVPGADSPYFDRERWKRDAAIDGRGHFLAGYDGAENEVCIGASDYWYLYRIS